MAETPSTLDKLATIAGRIAIALPAAGGVLTTISVSAHALAAFLDSKEADADRTQLDRDHAEYERRKAIAKDPNS